MTDWITVPRVYVSVNDQPLRLLDRRIPSSEVQQLKAAMAAVVQRYRERKAQESQ